MSTQNLPDVQWRKSSRSGGQGGDCVEIADATSAILVRDSKDPNGPRLALAPTIWRAFAQHVKADAFDLRG
ncbi:DUF397 domain-containing protein [Actinomadura litoris]|uniref:DUF397 domain-containing protein n=1 Tax=Actinomadura litoris TaxID=2678616 RepID=UPI001FA6F69B|nr:DUF397 domain-containing protein [Actinomadura litoris]